jgi:cysteine desulfurase
VSAGRAYLDWNASAPLRSQARAAMAAALDLVGNPSSVHAEGRAARHVIETARDSVAALFDADPRCVTFTAGGTEANVMALTCDLGPEAAPRRDGLLLSAIEHPSVLAGGRFPENLLEIIPVTNSGIVDLEALDRRLYERARAGHARPLVALMLANNETGAIQPVAEAARLVHQAGGLLVVDAVQAVGKIDFTINGIGADILTVSGHKIGAPKGVGALIRRDRGIRLGPLLRGGGQEQGLRGGTENVAAIAGFGAAAQAVRENGACERQHCAALRDALERRLRALSPAHAIFAAAVPRLPNTSLFAHPGVKAETAVIALDLAGVSVSSGSACSSGKVRPSHVLAAMGVEAPLAGGAVRVSFGPQSTESDLESFLHAWNKLLGPLLKASDTIAA